MTLHKVQLKMVIWIETDEDPNIKINEALDRLADAPTKDFGVFWDDIYWDTTEVCTDCHAVDPMGEDAWHSDDCKLVKN